MAMEWAEAALLVVLGGLFGWMLSKLPEKWVYLIAAIALVAAVVVLSQ